MSDAETDGEGGSADAGDTDADAAGADGEGAPDTAPEVELGLYQIDVRVRGSADDDLDDVEGTARELVDHLVDQAQQLEDEPDGRGLG
jgi:hypothetical protein